jgi:hypothetical protein
LDTSFQSYGKLLFGLDKGEGFYMKNGWYIVYTIILAFVSFMTGEFVTFIMLGLILITLENIHTTLKKALNKHED